MITALSRPGLRGLNEILLIAPLLYFYVHSVLTVGCLGSARSAVDSEENEKNLWLQDRTKNGGTM